MKRQPYTIKDIRLFEEFYHKVSNRAMVMLISGNRTESAIKTQAHKLGLHKTDRYWHLRKGR